MRTSLMALVALGLTGCASNSGVIPMGPDTFMVSRQAATGFSGSGTLKAEAIKEAGAHCIAYGKQLRVLHVTEAQPPFLLGNFPKADVEFACDPAPKRQTAAAEN